jgi:hypothetical protein
VTAPSVIGGVDAVEDSAATELDDPPIAAPLVVDSVPVCVGAVLVAALIEYPVGSLVLLLDVCETDPGELLVVGPDDAVEFISPVAMAEKSERFSVRATPIPSAMTSPFISRTPVR